MSRKDLHMIDSNDAKLKIEEYIARTETQLAVVKQVIEALKAEDGKKISHHVAKRLAKQYPSLKFSIDQAYSWCDLKISGEGFNAIQLQLAYNSEPKVINIARITELNQRYLLDEVRIPQYRAVLAVIDQKIGAYNKAITDLMDAQRGIDKVKFMFTDNETMYGYDVNGRAIWN